MNRRSIENLINTTPYKVEEEVIYKNFDHIESGIMESISRGKCTDSPIFDQKFKKGYKIKASFDTVISRDAKDFSHLPYTSNVLKQYD